MAIRHITGKLYDAAGNFVTEGVAIEPIKVPFAVSNSPIQVKPDSDGNFDFKLKDGLYKVYFKDKSTKKASVNQFTTDFTSVFVEDDYDFNKSDVEYVKDLVAYVLTHRIIQSPSGKMFVVVVDDEGNLTTEFYE